jgi:hypothetical protein
LAILYPRPIDNLPFFTITGADPSGIEDSTTSIQNAINAADAANGGVILIPPGSYKISSTLIANKGTYLNGLARTDDTSNTNGSGTLGIASPRIFWAGGAGGTMFRIVSATSGNCVWGGGSLNIEWDGSSIAGTAVHFNNTKYTDFDGRIRNVRVQGILIDADNGTSGNFTMKNRVRSLEFVYGVSADTENAHGIVMRGKSTTVPGTQQLVDNVFALVKNGYAVVVEQTDNAQFLSVHSSVDGAGTGGAAWLRSVGGSFKSDHNVFYYIVGSIKIDNGLIGNTFVNYNSEGAGINAGTTTYNGELSDYVTGYRYTTHKFKLRDKLSIPTGAISGDANVTGDRFALQWVAPVLSSSLDQKIGAMIPSPYAYAAGVIEAVEVIVGTNGTSGGNYNLTLNCSTVPPTLGSGPTVTPEYVGTQTIAAGDQYTPKTITFTPSPGLVFSRNDHIFVSLQRNGNSSANDTNNDGMFVLGMHVIYASSGPNSPGSGTYTIPNW